MRMQKREMEMARAASQPACAAARSARCRHMAAANRRPAPCMLLALSRGTWMDMVTAGRGGHTSVLAGESSRGMGSGRQSGEARARGSPEKERSVSHIVSQVRSSRQQGAACKRINRQGQLLGMRVSIENRKGALACRPCDGSAGTASCSAGPGAAPACRPACLGMDGCLTPHPQAPPCLSAWCSASCRPGEGRGEGAAGAGGWSGRGGGRGGGCQGRRTPRRGVGGMQRLMAAAPLGSK